MKSSDWLENAACRGTDVNIFFQEPRQGGDVRYVEARSMCTVCPVRGHCLESAIDEEWDAVKVYGMRGNTSGKERSKILRERRKKAK